MTRLIKASDLSSNRIYARPASLPAPVREAPDAVARQEAEVALAAVKGQVQALQDELERLRVDHAQACQEMYEKGVEDGKSSVIRTHGEQLQAFEQALTQAADTISTEIQALQTLSVDIALTALGQIVADPSGRRDLIQETVSRMIATLSTSEVLSIEVSRLDFPDPSACEALQEQGRLSGVSVNFGDGPVGTCKAHLQFGSIDLDLSTQLPRLADIMQDWKA